MITFRAGPGAIEHVKLPDRQDFYRYGQDHAGRIRDWERAIGECERFAEAVLRWLERPDPGLLRPI